MSHLQLCNVPPEQILFVPLVLVWDVTTHRIQQQFHSPVALLSQEVLASDIEIQLVHKEELKWSDIDISPLHEDAKLSDGTRVII